MILAVALNYAPHRAEQIIDACAQTLRRLFLVLDEAAARRVN